MVRRRSAPSRITLQLGAAADVLGGQQAMHVVDAADGQVVDRDDQVLGAQAGGGGRRRGRDLDHLDAAVAADRSGDARRQRARPAGDPDPGAAHAAVAHQRGDDAAGGRVDGDREAEPDAGDGGVDADDVAAAVDERAAGVAGVERRVGLDDVVDDPGRLAGARRQRAAERGHHAGGHRAGEAVRVADRDDELADAQRGGVAELGRRVRLALGAQDGEVGERVRSHHARLDLAAVGERGLNARPRRAGSRRRARR